MQKSEIMLRVNGEDHRMQISPLKTLLDVLRSDLGLYGARNGCGIGICGACTVLVDNQPFSSCLLLAFQAEGKEIITVEGLERVDGSLHPVQQAFVDYNAFQCSYCTPGLILSALSLIEINTHPDDEAIKKYLVGNLCRCGSYENILEAVKSLADEYQPEVSR